MRPRLRVHQIRGSIHPFLQAVGNMLEEYSGWRRILPWHRGRANIEEVAALVADIRGNRVNLAELMVRLREGALAQNVVMQRCLVCVEQALVLYLTRGSTMPGVNGWNALMIAARHNPQGVPALISAMAGLTQEQRFQILCKLTTSGGGWNALMLAARDQPQAVAPLVTIINGLSQDQRYAILNKVTSHGWSALMLAVRNHLQAVAPLIAAMNGLSSGQRYAILNKTTSGFNALMLAVRYQSQAVVPLVATMKDLSEGQRYVILSRVSSQGWDALMFAARYCSGAVAPLISVMKDLKPEQCYAILSKTSTDGSSSLTLAQQTGNTEAIELICNAMREVGLLQPALVAEQSAASSSTQFAPELIDKLRDLSLLWEWKQEGNSPVIFVQSANEEELENAASILRGFDVMDVSVTYIRATHRYNLSCSAIDVDALMAISLKPAVLVEVSRPELEEEFGESLGMR